MIECHAIITSSLVFASILISVVLRLFGETMLSIYGVLFFVLLVKLLVLLLVLLRIMHLNNCVTVFLLRRHIVILHQILKLLDII